MGARKTLGPAYFDAMYAAADDPWSFETRWYEKRKYAITVALLPAERYASAFEPACSIGVLTRLLAQRCDGVLSCDVSAAAVRSARARTCQLPNVTVEQRHIPADWPAASFDLIVASEFLYYFGDKDLGRTLELAVTTLRPGGTLLAVHWRHPVAEYPFTGDEVHQALRDQAGLAGIAGYRDADFLAEAYVRAGRTPASVACAGDLA